MPVLPDVATHSLDGVTYYTFTPAGAGPDTPIFVSVHGISRNADEHINLYVPYAKQLGVILISPLFEESKFPGYQHLGQNADGVLIKIINEVKARTGSRVPKIRLSGSSGGGQFAHRFMFKHSYMVERVAVSAAGWYTFPDVTREADFGIKYTGWNLLDILKVPAMVIVGEFDDENEGTFADDADINDYEGRGRKERGRRWIEALTNESRFKGYNTEYKFQVVPGAGHDFGVKGWCYDIWNFVFPQPAVEYGPNVLVNGDFEQGTSSGWTLWKPAGQSSHKVKIDTYSPFGGKYYADIYSSYPYEQAIHQKVSGIPNGKYEVSAWVKQKQTEPNISRMEIYDHQGEGLPWVFDYIHHLNFYTRIKVIVEVTSGKIGLGFYVKSPGATRLDIDCVEIRRILN